MRFDRGFVGISCQIRHLALASWPLKTRRSDGDLEDVGADEVNGRRMCRCRGCSHDEITLKVVHFVLVLAQGVEGSLCAVADV